MLLARGKPHNFRKRSIKVNTNNNDRRSCATQAPQRPPFRPDYFLPPIPFDAAVTMAYVPFQTDHDVYDEMKALEKGTLFPCLDKPYLGWRCRNS